MENGKLIPPKLDDWTFEEIRQAAIASISIHTPEWTDHNPSDLGITLLELFAWIAEQMIYRLNRVPEKNYLAFLNLLGITRNPPTPAKVDLIFRPATDEAVTIPKGTQAATPVIGTEEGVIFETNEAINAINIKEVLLRDAGGEIEYLSSNLLKAPYKSVEIPLQPGAASLLLLGVGKPTTKTLTLRFQLASDSDKIPVKWHYSNEGAPPEEWPEVKVPGDISFTKDFTASLTISDQHWGKYAFDVIKDKKKNEVVEIECYWVALRLVSEEEAATVVTLSNISGNRVPAENALTIDREIVLGTSNGKPFQVFSLKHAPLYKDPLKKGDPYHHLTIAVEDAGAWSDWTRVEAIDEGEKTQYICNPVTGEISFGNYQIKDGKKSGNGKIPPRGSRIKARTYRYVAGGADANVPAGAIKILRTPVLGVGEVLNELPAREGSDWEDMEDAKRRAPQEIKSRQVAVTVADYEELAINATTDLAKVRCLPPKKKEGNWITEPFNRTPGHVTLLIVPRVDSSVRIPRPSQNLINTVEDYFSDRKVITSILLRPTSPIYREISVYAKVYIKPGLNNSELKELEQRMRERIYTFLHPVEGGLDGNGWEIGQPLYEPDVYDVLKNIPGVSYVEEVKLGVQTLDDDDQPVNDLNEPDPITGVRVNNEEYHLICSVEESRFELELLIDEGR